MTGDDRGPTAALIVRAWIEGEPETGLRARVTSSLDVESEAETVATADSVEAFCAIARDWMERFIAKARAERRGDGIVMDR